MQQPRQDEPHDWREGRRLRAWALHQQGWTQTAIAQAFGVTQGTVSQWLKRGRYAGESGLRRRPAPGAQARLSDAQRVEFTTLLAHGAEAFGFLGAVWTRTRVVAVIHRHFGVRYHHAHVMRLCGRSASVSSVRSCGPRSETRR